MTDLIDPSATILMIMDYQPLVLAGLPNGQELVSRAAETIAFARSKALHIGYVRVALDDSERAVIPPANKAFFPMVGTTLLDKDAPEAAVHEKVAPLPGDVSVRKCRVSAFSTTDLDDQLGGCGVTTIVFGGAYTSGVVLSSMRDASDRDYRLLVAEDLCGDPDREVHDLLMTKVFPRQGDVIDTSHLRQLLDS